MNIEESVSILEIQIPLSPRFNLNINMYIKVKLITQLDTNKILITCFYKPRALIIPTWAFFIASGKYAKLIRKYNLVS